MKLATLYFVLLFLYTSCADSSNRQEIDLSDSVVQNPVDGVGHYVYAMSMPREVAPGEQLDVQMEWRTVGSVDPNARYTMDVRLSGPAQKEFEVPAGANTVGELHLANWLSYDFEVPEDFPAGDYVLAVRLRDSARDFAEVPLGYREELRMGDGFYRLGEFTVRSGL